MHLYCMLHCSCLLFVVVCLFALMIQNGCGDEDEESVARIQEKVGKQKGCMGPHQT